MEFLLWDICESKRLTSGDLRFQNECKWKYKFVGFGYFLVSVNQFSREWFFVEVIPGMMSRRYVNIHIAGTFQKCSDWNRDDIGWLARASGIRIQCNASMKMLVSEAAYQEWLVFLFFSIIFLLPWNRYGWICLNKRTVLKLYCLLDYLPFILKHLPLLPFVFSLFSLINRNLTSPFTTTLKLLPLKSPVTFNC